MADDMSVIYCRHQKINNLIRSNDFTRSYNTEFSDCQHIYNSNNFRFAKTLAVQTLYLASGFQKRKDNLCHKRANISIIVTKIKPRQKKAKTIRECHQQSPQTQNLTKSKDELSPISTHEYLKIMAKKCSMPVIYQTDKKLKNKKKRRRSEIYLNTSTPYRTKFVVNAATLDPKTIPFECQRLLKHPLMQAQLRIYRCQLSTKEEICCCECNSDAMFEVMKGLYDCYKKKDCNNCNCVLCGHLAREERRLGETRKSMAASMTPSMKERRKELMKKAKDAGLLTPLKGKPPEEKERLVKELAKMGLPLPVAQTNSEKNIIDKVRKDLGLPPEPKTAAQKKNYQRAENLGLIEPLEGKTKPEKEKILRQLHDLGIELPEGRTASEKSIISQIKAGGKKPIRAPSEKGKGLLSIKGIPSEKLRKAKEAGFLTPLEGKTPEQKEKIIRGLALSGIPLPEGKSASEKKLISKVRTDLGLPPEPKSDAEKDKYSKAHTAGLITPLEGKTPAQKEKILRGLAGKGIPLPEGRTPSEKALIDKIKAEVKPTPSEKMRTAKEAGFLTPLEGKTPEQKEKIIRGLAQSGIPLPEGKSASEKKLISKVRTDLGLPPEPKSGAEKDKYSKAHSAGLITPLEGKTPAQKEKILRGLAQKGIPLPEGRTPSEKALIDKIKAEVKAIPSEKLRKAKAAGFLTPLEGKPPEQKEKILRGMGQHGIPLPEGKTASEKKLIDKVRKDLGLPAEPKTDAEKQKLAKAYGAGLITPLEGKTPAQKDKILRGLAEKGIPLPEGRTASEKALIDKVKAEVKPIPSAVHSEKMRKAKAAGFLTPLEGKPPEQKEKILRGMGQHGIPLPEGKTASEKKLIDKVRKDLGLPAEPKTDAEKQKLAKAYGAGLITPLEGKTPAQKDKILRGLAEKGIPLPEGRTASEKALIAKIKADVKPIPSVMPVHSEKMRKAKAAGFDTPLEGKTPAQKEKILRGLGQHGIPLPEGKTASEKKLVEKVRRDLGLPEEPKTNAEKLKLAGAYGAGLITPLEGKSAAQKEKILRGLAENGIPLPEGRTASEKALIDKIKAEVKPVSSSVIAVPSEKMRKARAAGLLTPLEGKTPNQKEKILRVLAMNGIPLPKGKTPSEQNLIDKVLRDLGLPPAPKTNAEKDKLAKGYAAGIVTPLEGKSPEQKEKVLRGLAEKGISLPEGRTPSEKALIDKIKAETARRPSEKMRRAKAAGLLTPLTGKTPDQKEKIVRGLAQGGLPLPEAKTPSEQKVIDKVRKDLGLPPEPKTAADREKYANALAAGLVTPLEGKSPAQKEKILRGLAEKGISLPEGRTTSEKALIDKVIAELKPAPSTVSEKMRKAKAAGLLTPLAGKTPEQKENIIKNLAILGLPLPEAKTASEKQLIGKIRSDLGLPPEPSTKSMKEKYDLAKTQGFITPLEGKTPAQKEKILRGRAAAGLPLPSGKTPSEKALIKKIKADTGYVTPPRKTKEPVVIPSEKLRKAKAAGLLTPLEGKTPAQKENLIRGLTKAGIPLPEPKTQSEKQLFEKVAREFPPEPETLSMKQKMSKARAAGIITPLEGKTPEHKAHILRKLADAGIPLPEGRTASEKALVKKIAAEAKKTQSTRLKEAKAAGLITPLDGKTKDQKEKILKGLAEAGLPLPEGKTASEKSMIKKIRDKYEYGTPSMKAKAAGPSKKGMGMVARSVAGIQEEVEEIVKIGTCERACGCDKKKIRFKHSYVKIRVTSPDISSFCACPDECLPGVKAGVFTDNDGIKVTVGSVIGVPSYDMYPTTEHNQNLLQENRRQTQDSDSFISSESHISLEIASVCDPDLTSDALGSTSTVYIFNSESDISIADIKHLLGLSNYNDNVLNNIEDYGQKDESVSYIYRPRYAVRSSTQTRKSYLKSGDPSVMDHIHSGFRLFYTVETESSLSVTSDSLYVMDTLSVLSLLERKLRYSRSLFCMKQSKSERSQQTDKIIFSVNENIVMPVQAFLKNSHFVNSTVDSEEHNSKKNDIDIYRPCLSKTAYFCDSQKPESNHNQNILKVLKSEEEDEERLIQKKNTCSSPLRVVFSTSGCYEGEFRLRNIDAVCVCPQLSSETISTYMTLFNFF